MKGTEYPRESVEHDLAEARRLIEKHGYGRRLEELQDAEEALLKRNAGKQEEHDLMSRPRVFISYSHDSDEHQKRVLGLSERLRQDGVDTILDQYVEGSPTDGWPRWVLNALDAATHVLCVCTESYYRRFRGHEVAGKGRGVDWEGASITQSLYEARSATCRFIPVLYARADEPHIPEPLRGQTFHLLDSEANYQSLYDQLLGQAGVAPGELGELKTRSRETGEPATFGESSKPLKVESTPVASGEESPALKVWREKLDFLLVEEAVSSDAEARFTLKHRIEEAQRKIEELADADTPIADVKIKAAGIVTSITLTLEQPVEVFDEQVFLRQLENLIGPDATQITITSVRAASTQVGLGGDWKTLTTMIQKLQAAHGTVAEFIQATGLRSYTWQQDGQTYSVSVAEFAAQNSTESLTTTNTTMTMAISRTNPTVVLITVNDNETDAVFDAFLGPGMTADTETRAGVDYSRLGIHGGHAIVHTICEMGAGGLGASQQRTAQAITQWQPQAVIAVGIAFGLDESKQEIGDVLISRQLQDYELGRLNADGSVTPRGDKVSCADSLLSRLRTSDTNQRRSESDWPKNRFGLVLSGQKLVDNLDYRESLKSLAGGEAIGGEMEGGGLYVSAQAAKVDWVVIKAICDWGHNKNRADKDAWQKLAAKNATRVVKAALDAGCIYEMDLIDGRRAVDLPDDVAQELMQGTMRNIHEENVRAREAMESITQRVSPKSSVHAANQPKIPSIARQDELLAEITDLPGAWFEQLVFKFDKNNAVPGDTSSQAKRALELIKILRVVDPEFAEVSAELQRLKGDSV